MTNGLKVVWTDSAEDKDYQKDFDNCVVGTVEIHEGEQLWKVVYEKDPDGHWWSEEWTLIGKGLELFF